MVHREILWQTASDTDTVPHRMPPQWRRNSRCADAEAWAARSKRWEARWTLRCKRSQTASLADKVSCTMQNIADHGINWINWHWLTGKKNNCRPWFQEACAHFAAVVAGTWRRRTWCKENLNRSKQYVSQVRTILFHWLKVRSWRNGNAAKEHWCSIEQTLQTIRLEQQGRQLSKQHQPL